MKKLAILSSLIVGIIFISCENEKKTTVEESNAVTNEVLQKIESLNLNTDVVEFTTVENLDGTKENVYLIEGCIAMSPEHLAHMEMHDGITGEQYRTYNLVGSPRTINVIGYTGGGNALTTKMKTGLRRAVANYNSLNMGLNFRLTFGTNYQSKDIVVYKVNGNAGGVAGFPSNGRPYKWVRIFSGTNNYSTNVNTHVIAHEIGHCLGLRHTDWNTRRSCGGSGEPRNPAGAVHIPGTPTGWDGTSLMRACFSSGESGNFGRFDKVALERLY